MNISNFFDGEYAGDAGEVVGYADVDPVWRVEERLYCWEAVVAEFQHEDAARFQVLRGLRDQVGVEFVAFFASEEGGVGFVVADFAGEGVGFTAADVGRIAGDEVKRR